VPTKNGYLLTITDTVQLQRVATLGIKRIKMSDFQADCSSKG